MKTSNNPIQPNVALRFAASGVVSVANGEAGSAALRLCPYAVMADGDVFLMSWDLSEGVAHSRLDPVPESAQAAISGAHPEMTLEFPQSPSRTPQVASAGELVEVDPSKLNLVYGGGTHIPQPELLKAGGKVIDGDWDRPLAKTFTEIDNYEALRDRMLNGVPWEETPLYKRVIAEIESGKTKWGCKTEAAYLRRCVSLERLYERIRDEGYKTQVELGTTRPEDEVRVAIARDGRMIFVDGRHRLSIVRILGLPRIPVRIVARHAQWQRFKDEILEYANNHRGRIYQMIDHPDLRDIPAQHTTDRIDLVRGALAGYDAAGKKLVDIGAHWGYMSQQLSDAGFEVTAIEASRNNKRIAEALAIATEANYTVWGGDLLDFPDVEAQDVVLALNIFHHLIKTEKGHESLKAYLKRFRADRILFEPHKHDPPGQMEGAYRNYAPQEFAEFIAEHAGMSQIDELGRADDGRLLYCLT